MTNCHVGKTATKADDLNHPSALQIYNALGILRIVTLVRRDILVHCRHRRESSPGATAKRLDRWGLIMGKLLEYTLGSDDEASGCQATGLRCGQ